MNEKLKSAKQEWLKVLRDIQAPIAKAKKLLKAKEQDDRKALAKSAMINDEDAEDAIPDVEGSRVRDLVAYIANHVLHRVGNHTENFVEWDSKVTLANLDLRTPIIAFGQAPGCAC